MELRQLQATRTLSAGLVVAGASVSPSLCCCFGKLAARDVHTIVPPASAVHLMPFPRLQAVHTPNRCGTLPLDALLVPPLMGYADIISGSLSWQHMVTRYGVGILMIPLATSDLRIGPSSALQVSPEQQTLILSSSPAPANTSCGDGWWRLIPSGRRPSPALGIDVSSSHSGTAPVSCTFLGARCTHHPLLRAHRSLIYSQERAGGGPISPNPSAKSLGHVLPVQ